jgi:hypothetical protein
MELRDVRQAPKALCAFLEVLHPNALRISITEAMHTAALPARSSLLRARLRFDIVAMLMQRCVHAHILANGQSRQFSYHVSCDASPQWRATELFGAWIDRCSTISSDADRRLLPLATLGYKHMSVSDKVCDTEFLVINNPSLMRLRCHPSPLLRTNMETCFVGLDSLRKDCFVRHTFVGELFFAHEVEQFRTLNDARLLCCQNCVSSVLKCEFAEAHPTPLTPNKFRSA